MSSLQNKRPKTHGSYLTFKRDMTILDDFFTTFIPGIGGETAPPERHPSVRAEMDSVVHARIAEFAAGIANLGDEVARLLEVKPVPVSPEVLAHITGMNDQPVAPTAAPELTTVAQETVPTNVLEEITGIDGQAVLSAEMANLTPGQRAQLALNEANALAIEISQAPNEDALNV